MLHGKGVCSDLPKRRSSSLRTELLSIMSMYMFCQSRLAETGLRQEVRLSSQATGQTKEELRGGLGVRPGRRRLEEDHGIARKRDRGGRGQVEGRGGRGSHGGGHRLGSHAQSPCGLHRGQRGILDGFGQCEHSPHRILWDPSKDTDRGAAVGGAECLEGCGAD